MKILFDLLSTQPYKDTTFHGGGEYNKKIFLTLINNIDKKDTVTGFYNSNRPIDDEILDQCKQENVSVLPIRSMKDIFSIISNHGYDKIFCGHEFNDVKLPEGIWAVNVLHGLRAFDLLDSNDFQFGTGLKNDLKFMFPKLYMMYKFKKINVQKNQIASMIRRTDLLITSSDASKYAILSHFGIDVAKKLLVIYPAAKKSSKPVSERVVSQKYFLLVSCNRYEKNAHGAIQAFDEIFSDFPSLREYRVVCTGGVPDGIRRKIVNLDQFIIKGYVDAAELEALYRDAYAFVYPSISEGFGYPPLEAMKYGTPVLASACTSIPEVCGSAAIYFNPYDVQEIKGRILKAMLEDISPYREKSFQRFAEVSKRQERDLDILIEKILE